MRKHLLLIVRILLTEAAACLMSVVNVAGKVAFLQSKVNEVEENGTERIRIYKRNVRTQ